jgi:hypothetical protein
MTWIRVRDVRAEHVSWPRLESRLSGSRQPSPGGLTEMWVEDPDEVAEVVVMLTSRRRALEGLTVMLLGAGRFGKTTMARTVTADPAGTAVVQGADCFAADRCDTGICIAVGRLIGDGDPSDVTAGGSVTAPRGIGRGDVEHYSKLSLRSAFPTECDILKNFTTRRRR